MGIDDINDANSDRCEELAEALGWPASSSDWDALLVVVESNRKEVEMSGPEVSFIGPFSQTWEVFRQVDDAELPPGGGWEPMAAYNWVGGEAYDYAQEHWVVWKRVKP